MSPAVQQHRTLRAAINAAAMALNGLVDKAGVNTQYDYAYVGHSHVIDHVRETLLAHGVVVLPTDLRFVRVLESRGSGLFLWKQRFSVEHVHSTERRTAALHVTTLAGEQSSAKASTAADRTFLMRLCRLAGRSDQTDSPRQQRGRAPAMGPTASERNQGAKPATRSTRGESRVEYDRETGEVRKPADKRERAVASLLDELAGLDKAPEARLVTFVSEARAKLDQVVADGSQCGRVWSAFEQRCKEARLDAKELMERAPVPSTNRRNTKP